MLGHGITTLAATGAGQTRATLQLCTALVVAAWCSARSRLLVARCSQGRKGITCCRHGREACRCGAAALLRLAPSSSMLLEHWTSG